MPSLDNLITVRCKPCLCCGLSSMLTVDIDRWSKWSEGVNIQIAFPDLSENDRELLITGTHSECWDKMFLDEI